MFFLALSLMHVFFDMCATTSNYSNYFGCLVFVALDYGLQCNLQGNVTVHDRYIVMGHKIDHQLQLPRHKKSFSTP